MCPGILYPVRWLPPDVPEAINISEEAVFMAEGQDYGGKTVQRGMPESAQHLEQGGEYAKAPEAASGKQEGDQSGIPSPNQRPCVGVRTDEVERRDEGQQPK
jgi:hypothetical protein